MNVNSRRRPDYAAAHNAAALAAVAGQTGQRVSALMAGGLGAGAAGEGEEGGLFEDHDGSASERQSEGSTIATDLDGGWLCGWLCGTLQPCPSPPHSCVSCST